MIHVRALSALLLVAALACGDSGSSTPDDAGSDAAPPAIPDEPRCEGFVDRQLAACGDAAEQREGALARCHDEADLYTSTGCGDAHEAWLDCAVKAESWDCKAGPSSCGALENTAYSCAAEFKRATFCTSHGRVEPRCTGATPYKFVCLMNQPPKASCTLYDAGEVYSFCCG